MGLVGGWKHAQLRKDEEGHFAAIRRDHLTDSRLDPRAVFASGKSASFADIQKGDVVRVLFALETWAVHSNPGEPRIIGINLIPRSIKIMHRDNALKRGRDEDKDQHGHTTKKPCVEQIDYTL
jgi:hypothetical protein